jgi:hypothetical protein
MLAFVVCGVVTALADWIGPSTAGSFGLEFRPTESALQLVVLSVDEGRPAASAGLRTGDRITLVDRSVYEFQTARANDSVRVKPDRGRAELRLTAQTARPRPFDRLWAIIRLFTLAVAVFVAFKRPQLVAARALAIFLASLGLLSNWDAYPGGWSFAGLVARQAAMVFGFPFFIVFAATFSGAADAFVSRYRQIALGLGALLAIELLVQQTLYFQNRLWRPVEIAVPLTILTFLAAGLLAFRTQLREAQGQMRDRIEWVLLTMAVSLSGAVCWLAFLALPAPPTWMDNFIWTMVALPAGLAYAIVRHRLLDISVVVSRTIGFAVVVFVLTMMFGTIEYLIIEIIKHAPGGFQSTWTSLRTFFSDPEHGLPPLATATVVAAVSTLVNRTHHRLDHVVKTLFFQERTRAVEELRRAAADLLFADDTKMLAMNVIKALDVNLRASGTAVYLREGGNFCLLANSQEHPARTIDANDAAVLRLMSSREPVLLANMNTGVTGTCMLPITSGARLTGACVLDFGSDGLPLDREQIEAAKSVLHSAAVAIESIRLRSQRRKIRALRAELRALRSRDRQSRDDTLIETTDDRIGPRGEPAA